MWLQVFVEDSDQLIKGVKYGVLLHGCDNNCSHTAFCGTVWTYLPEGQKADMGGGGGHMIQFQF